ncbi:putative proline-rich protein [Favolaschia claudopus]|uniref:Proline-rich protein n=1 Tax=Favolaschia claudopus TaxID=2862362 RepID=A0AAW0CHS0_9AGAR
MPPKKRKSQDTEILTQKDVNNTVTEFSPIAGTQWFMFKPNASSSREQENYSPLPSPTKTPKPPPNYYADTRAESTPIDISSDSDSNTDSDQETHVSPTPVDDVDEATPEIVSRPAKKRKSRVPVGDKDGNAESPEPRAKKRKSKAAAPVDDDPDALDMSFCLEVETPSPPVLTVRKSNVKPVPPKTTTLGPFEIKSDIQHPQFIRIIAKACQTTRESLVLASMEWKFDRPNTSRRRPLTDEVGLRVAIKALADRRKDYAFTVFMAPPQATTQDLPWLDRAGDSGPLNFEYTLDELTTPGNSVISVRQQIAGIDNASNPFFEELKEKYPIDNHPSFPGKRIFHNDTGYFHLDDVKLRVWAVAIAKGTADVNRCPVSSHFRKEQTIRPPAPPAAPPIAPALPQAPLVPATGSDATLQLLLQAITGSAHIPYGLHPHHAYHPHQYALPPPPPFAALAPGPAPAAATAEPPSIELPRRVSLEEYCERYQIAAEDRRVLGELGYEPGDSGLTGLEKEVWDGVKALPLAKNRILRQHASFVKDVVAGLWN